MCGISQKQKKKKKNAKEKERKRVGVPPQCRPRSHARHCSKASLTPSSREDQLSYLLAKSILKVKVETYQQESQQVTVTVT